MVEVAVLSKLGLSPSRVEEMASLARHHQGDGPASSLGRVSMGTEQLCGGDLVEAEAVDEVDSESANVDEVLAPVSYTHLTLPTKA